MFLILKGLLKEQERGGGAWGEEGDSAAEVARGMKSQNICHLVSCRKSLPTSALHYWCSKTL